MIPRYSRSFPRNAIDIAGVVFCLVCANLAVAGPVTLNFSVQVDTRETHDDLYGFTTNNWLLDTTFSGAAFSMSWSLDTDTLSSSNSLFTIQGRVEGVDTPATPLDDELDAVLTRWAPANPSASLALSQSVNLPDLTKDIYLSIDAFDARYDHPDPFSSTEQMRWGMLLRHAAVGEIFSDQQHVDGYLMTGDDMAAYLQELAAGGAEFSLLAFSEQSIGTFGEFSSDRSSMQGLRYSGVATLVPEGSVPAPSTLWLFVAGIALLRRAR